MDEHHIAGAVVLVADASKVLATEAVGMMDIEARKPMRTDCMFWIASMTKSITCTALMMLVDEGKKLEPAFRSAALAAFSKRSTPSANP